MPGVAIENTLGSAIGRDLDRLGSALGSWLGQRWPGATLDALEVPSGSGASSELMLLTVSAEGDTGFSGRRMVLRIAPEWQVYPTVDLPLQAACMNAAAVHSRAPVPRVFAAEPEGCDGLNRPFILMEHMNGAGAPDFPSYVVAGWIHDLDTVAQRKLWWSGVESIAAFHATDIRAAGLDERARLPTPGGSPLARMLSYWKLFLELVEQRGRYHVLRESVRWLHEAQPVMPESEGLVWGDASLRNMLFEKKTPSALLDFEFAHLGLQAFDIVFYSLMDHVMARGFAGNSPRLTGFPGVNDTLDYYERISGRTITHRQYLARMALTYMALSTTRVYQRLEAAGQITGSEVAGNPPLEMLGQVLAGEPLPD